VQDHVQTVSIASALPVQFPLDKETGCIEDGCDLLAVAVVLEEAAVQLAFDDFTSTSNLEVEAQQAARFKDPPETAEHGQELFARHVVGGCRTPYGVESARAEPQCPHIHLHEPNRAHTLSCLREHAIRQVDSDDVMSRVR